MLEILKVLYSSFSPKYIMVFISKQEAQKNKMFSSISHPQAVLSSQLFTVSKYLLRYTPSQRKKTKPNSAAECLVKNHSNYKFEL